MNVKDARFREVQQIFEERDPEGLADLATCLAAMKLPSDTKREDFIELVRILKDAGDAPEVRREKLEQSRFAKTLETGANLMTILTPLLESVSGPLGAAILAQWAKG